MIAMNSKNAFANATIAGSFAAALTMIAAPAFAEPKPPQPTMDKCYGIALNRDNDYAAAESTTSSSSANNYNLGNAQYYSSKGPNSIIKKSKVLGPLNTITIHTRFMHCCRPSY